jgi:hypothetical protein
MLRDLFGDTPQVEAIEKIVENTDDWHKFASKKEIINHLKTSEEEIGSFNEDFLKLLYLVKYELSEIYRILSLKDKIDNILPNKPSFKEEFDEISKNYFLYEKEFVKRFFTERYGLISYVNHITPVINSHFKDYQKMIVFNQDPEFDSLSNIRIYIKSSEEFKERDEETLNKLKNEIRKCNLFPNDIKNICSIKLDCNGWYFNDYGNGEEYERFIEIYKDFNEKIMEIF